MRAEQSRAAARREQPLRPPACAPEPGRAISATCAATARPSRCLVPFAGASRASPGLGDGGHEVGVKAALVKGLDRLGRVKPRHPHLERTALRRHLPAHAHARRP